MDEARRELRVRDELVEVTPTEWGLLAALAHVPGRVYSRFELINRCGATSSRATSAPSTRM